MPAYGSSASGLQCSWGSDLDMKIPRQKAPPRALPDCIRKKLVGVKAEPSGGDDGSVAVYQAGGGVLQPRESSNGEYRAGCQKNFLRRHTGVAMSERTSGYARQNGQPHMLPAPGAGFGSGSNLGKLPPLAAHPVAMPFVMEGDDEPEPAHREPPQRRQRQPQQQRPEQQHHREQKIAGGAAAPGDVYASNAGGGRQRRRKQGQRRRPQQLPQQQLPQLPQLAGQPAFGNNGLPPLFPSREEV